MSKKILYFSAIWCGPCRMMNTIIDELKQDHIPIEKLDVDTNSEKVKKYGVRSIPTFILLNDDIEGGRLIGGQSKNNLLTFYNN